MFNCFIKHFRLGQMSFRAAMVRFLCFKSVTNTMVLWQFPINGCQSTSSTSTTQTQLMWWGRWETFWRTASGASTLTWQASVHETFITFLLNTLIFRFPMSRSDPLTMQDAGSDGSIPLSNSLSLAESPRIKSKVRTLPFHPLPPQVSTILPSLPILSSPPSLISSLNPSHIPQPSSTPPRQQSHLQHIPTTHPYLTQLPLSIPPIPALSTPHCTEESERKVTGSIPM